MVDVTDRTYRARALQALTEGHKVLVKATKESSLIAEGIETTGKLRHLRRLGCDWGQGFLFSAALATGDVAALRASDLMTRSGMRDGDPDLVNE
jgi:EAL domain-containing protein (putative c-di-GMP-specific phosphodiesterase class I)